MAVADVVATAVAAVEASVVGDAIQACTINRHIEGTNYDPVTGIETGGSDETYSAKIVIGESPTDNQYKDIGVKVTANDVEAYILQPEVAPVTTDTLTVGSNNYEIVFMTDAGGGVGDLFKTIIRLNNG